jgi:deoxyadenosine/deoxycytidine kinase
MLSPLNRIEVRGRRVEAGISNLLTSYYIKMLKHYKKCIKIVTSLFAWVLDNRYNG